MADTFEFTRPRSKLWFKISITRTDIGDVITRINISANMMTKRLITLSFPKLIGASPTSWKLSRNWPDMYNLWIPHDRITKDISAQLRDLIAWGEKANAHIWLGLNRKIEAFFSGNEVDFCVAADWNFDPLNKDARTQIGEAEYQLKYNLARGQLTQTDRDRYGSILRAAVDSCLACLPDNRRNWYVAPIPCTESGRKKLAYELAQAIASRMNIPFIDAELASKPVFKNATVRERITGWRGLLSEKEDLILSMSPKDKTILVIDDLYQSGASVWCFADFLKRMEADQVIAIVPVKALKDGDNT